MYLKMKRREMEVLNSLMMGNRESPALPSTLNSIFKSKTLKARRKKKKKTTFW